MSSSSMNALVPPPPPDQKMIKLLYETRREKLSNIR